MAKKFYKDSDGLWWINNKVVIPSKDFSFRVDNPASPTIITLQGSTNVFKDDDFKNVVIATIEDEGGTPYGDWTTFKAAVRDFFSRAVLQHGGMALTDKPVIDLAIADDYYQIEGAWAVFPTPVNFEIDIPNSRLYYRGVNDITFLVNGTSDVKSSKVAIITYGLFKNGTLVPGAESPHTFGSANAVELMAITALIDLKKDDYLEIHAKSTTASTDLTPQSLAITFFGSV